MPPRSRGAGLKPPQATPTGLQSRSTPNLPTLRALRIDNRALNPSGHVSTQHTTRAMAASPDDWTASADNTTSPSEAASVEGLSLESTTDLAQLPSPELSDEDDDDDVASGEGEDGSVSNLPVLGRSISHNQQSRSHTYLGPSAFAPPFYNRPPTPLPPSPSLTSLLRPTFSSQNSRPTTPDPSSDEGATLQTRAGDITGSHTSHSAAASTLTSTFRSAKPIPRASPKVPTYEYYGFTLYLTSSLAFIVYLLWAFLPSPFLHQVGVYYYPNRWWALAIPAWTVMFILYMYVALAAYNTGYLTLPMKSVECLVDEAANVAVLDADGKLASTERPSWRNSSPERAKASVSSSLAAKKGMAASARGKPSRQNSLTKTPATASLDWRSLWNEGTDAVMDVPIGGICEILYGGASDDDEEHDDSTSNA